MSSMLLSDTDRQMSLGKAAGEDEVTAELLKFGGDNLWEVVVRVCREQWLLLTEAAPGAEVVWPQEWCVGLVVPLWKRKGNKKDKNTWRGITLLSVGSKLLARVVATRLRSWFDGHLGLHQFGFRRGKGVDDHRLKFIQYRAGVWKPLRRLPPDPSPSTG